jgi:DNA polymerase-1
MPEENYERSVSGDGPMDAKIVILTESPSYNDLAAKRPLSDFTGKLLFNQFMKAGVPRSRIRVESLYERMPPARKSYLLDPLERRFWEADCIERLSKLRPWVLVPLGEECLKFATGLSGIGKWHLSILKAQEGLGGVKTIPLLSPEYIQKVFKEIPFLTFGASRIAEESKFEGIRNVERNFTVKTERESGDVQEFVRWMHDRQDREWLSLDIETSQGHITCIGFSTDPREAICIPTLPRDYEAEEFFFLWSEIAKFLGSGSKKVGQNLIYDSTYLSKYGVRIKNIYHDTMICQKFLHPELPMGLDTIARLYSKEPYWKDEGKNWGMGQDVSALYFYNCKDVAVTLECALAQRNDLKMRGLEDLFYKEQMQYTKGIQEMCWSGLRIDESKREELRSQLVSQLESYGTSLQSEARRVMGKEINPRSPQQVKELLKAYGYRLPTKDGQETSNKEALLKLRLKDPESKILTPLIQISEANKRISSYIDYENDPDHRVRYSLYNHKTESGRWAGGLDPWGRGFNVQTIPSELKGQFCASEGSILVEIDLKQAESRFVAWDGPVPKLIEMYKSGIDIHRFVASHPLLFNKPMDAIQKEERQLGKKVGHAANYDVGPATMANSCLIEMDLVLSVNRAEKMLAGYHQIFDGAIRKWHQKIQEELQRSKKLKTPMGYERYFYDRIGPDLYREAYAYRPQNTVVAVINKLLRHLFGKNQITLLAQIHDALLLETPHDNLKQVIQLVKDQDSWNPTMILSGGDFRIPVEMKAGNSWKSMELVYEG